MFRIFTSIILSLMMTYCFGQSSLDLQGNSSLTYIQTINGDKSDVKIAINKDVSEAAPKISWSINTNGKSSTKIYNYTAKSVENGDVIYLKIDESMSPQPGSNIMLLSKKSFAEISAGKTAFHINGGAPSGFEVLGKEPYQLNINGKSTQVEVYHLKVLGGGPNEELWILNNPKNPLILKSSGVYNLELTEVKQ